MATKQEFIIHRNGGGKKHRTATVPKSVFLPKYSTVGADTNIQDQAIIEDEVTIGDHCFIGHGSTIRNGSLIGNGCEINGGTLIGHKTRIGENSRISTNIGAWCIVPTGTIDTLYIHGTRHSITAFGKDHTVQIGCRRASVEWWLRYFRLAGRDEAYSAKEVREYGAYIQAAKVFLDTYYPIKKARKTARKAK